MNTTNTEIIQDTSAMLSTDEVRKLEDTAMTMYENTRTLEITKQGEYENEGLRLQIIKKQYKEIESKRKELIKPFQDATKRLNEFFKNPLNLLKEAEDSIKKAMLKYQRKIEEERIKEQKKLDEIAERERKKLEKRAEKYREKGNEEKANELFEEATFVPHHKIVKMPEKIEGIQTRDNWKFRIIDVNKLPREYMIPDEKRLGEIARAGKGLVKIEGVEFYNEPVIASKAL